MELLGYEVVKLKMRSQPAPHGDAYPHHASATHPLLSLQRQAGNHAVQAFLHRAGVQAKLAVSQPDDPAEREADQVADRIMRKHGGAPTSSACSCAAGGDMCEECQQKQQPVIARKAESGFNANEAPPLVADVLRSSGQPLSAAARSSLAPKFGRDLGNLRIHDDSAAAESASAIDALAYTLGNHIVFGEGQYTPGTQHGDRLLAHEITHTIQQGGGAASQSGHGILQRVCRPDPHCATGFPGDTGRFAEKVFLDEEAQRRSSNPTTPPGAPVHCLAPHHKEKAVNITTLMSRVGVALPPEVAGVFVNACLSSKAGGQTNLCSAFPDGAPVGTDPAKSCVQVSLDDENDAKAILLKPTRDANDNAKVLEMSRVIIHESEHATFNKNPPSVPAASPGDCDLNTVIFHAPSGRDFNVKFYLSEMAAQTAEFAPFFQNTKTSPGPDSMRTMFDEERNLVLHPDENILGIIKSLQCHCNCDTVDKLVADVLNSATASWPADQKDEFQKAMTRMIPSFWPKALQKT